MTSDEVKQSYSMRDVLSMYGISIKKGFCCCPFHHEKTGSMKIYKDSYNCFGCGANGDIFSFVQGMENCSFKEAFLKLGGTYEEKSSFQQKKFKYELEQKKRKEQLEKQKRKREWKELLKDIHYQKLFQKLSPVYSDSWCDATNKLERDFLRLEEMTEGGVDFD